MPGNFKRLISSNIIKNFFIYSFGSFFLKGISIFIAPIIMRILTPADYGLLALTTSFINIVVTLAGLGMRQLLSIEYFHCDATGRKGIINDILTVYVAVMVPVFIFLSFNIPIINRYIFVNKGFTLLIAISLLVAFVQFFVELFYQIMQYLGVAARLTLIQTSAAILIIFLNLTFLYVFRFGIVGIIFSQGISLLIVLVVAFFAYLKNFYHINLRISHSLKKSWWYIAKGLPFIPRILFAWILAVGDRWILAKYSTMHNVGIYSVADMFGQLFQFVIIMPISYAYIPPLLERFASNKDKILSIERWNQKNMWICMLGIFVLVSVAYVVFKPLVFIIFPQKFHEAMRYVWFLLIGYILLLGSYFPATFLQFQKKIYFLVFALFVPAVFNVFLNILLIPHFEIFGCVIATVVSYFIYFVIMLSYNWHIRNKIS